MAEQNSNKKALAMQVTSSIAAVEALVSVAETFSLSLDYVGILSDIAYRSLQREIAIPQIEQEIAAKMGFDPEKSRRLAVALCGGYLLAVDDWLEGAVASYLQSCGANLVQFASTAAMLQMAPQKEQMLFEQENIPEEPFVFVPRHPEEEKEESAADPQEKDDMVELFEHKVLDILSLADTEVVEEYNNFLVSSFSEDSRLYVAIQQALRSNQEKIEEKKIVLGDKEVAATIANFISDLLKSMPSSEVSEMALAHYFSSSANFAKLSPEGKDRLRKVFRLYLNLWLLFENLGRQAIGEIEIFPVEKEPILPSQDHKVHAPEPVAPRAEVKEAELDMLEQMLSHYVPGSLEHKAITEEMGRIRSASKR